MDHIEELSNSLLENPQLPLKILEIHCKVVKQGSSFCKCFQNISSPLEELDISNCNLSPTVSTKKEY